MSKKQESFNFNSLRLLTSVARFLPILFIMKESKLGVIKGKLFYLLQRIDKKWKECANV